MKTHYIGLALWAITSFFSADLLAYMLAHYIDLGTVWKWVINFLLVVIMMLGIHKFIFGIMLMIKTDNPNFNKITTAYSIVGLFGLLAGLFANRGILGLIKGMDNNSTALSITFAIFILVILFRGFVFLPKALRLQ